jgi:hypothetical protein
MAPKSYEALFLLTRQGRPRRHFESEGYTDSPPMHTHYRARAYGAFLRLHCYRAIKPDRCNLPV